MNSSNQSVVITPIFQDLDNVPEYVSVNGEMYYLLKETRLYELKRIQDILQFILLSFFNNQTNVTIGTEEFQAALEYPLFNLQAIVREINAFKFHSSNP